ncbi:SANT/Myb-like DNA-binding domain-containing protein [Acetobacter sp.]|uniref:SANT/Myb-like DNA-binding domain-containing protein n=1 Tax=Acetobacter sp. TaxID=440 RepID=UPI0039E917AB
MNDGRKTWTSEEVEAVVTLRNQGHAWRAIARHLGRSDVMCQRHYEQHLGAQTNQVRSKPHLKGKPLPSLARLPTKEDSLLTENSAADRARNTEPLRVGHPIVMRGLWHGLERWRPKIEDE